MRGKLSRIDDSDAVDKAEELLQDAGAFYEGSDFLARKREAYLNAGKKLAGKGEIAEAKERYETANELELDPSLDLAEHLAQAYRLAGKYWVQKDDMDRARELFEEYKSSHPNTDFDPDIEVRKVSTLLDLQVRFKKLTPDALVGTLAEVECCIAL